MCIEFVKIKAIGTFLCDPNTSVMNFILFFGFTKEKTTFPPFINLKIGLQKLNYLTDEGRITGYSADVN